MSILIDRNTKVITQGITGKTGQFHTRGCRDYANGKNCFVAGALGVHAGDEAGAAVGVVAAAPRMKLAGLAGDALRDDAGVLVDQDAHLGPLAFSARLQRSWSRLRPSCWH